MLTCIHDFKSLLQEALCLKESELGELKKNIKHQEAETLKAESKFKFCLKENEELKAKFATKRAAWETKKADLMKHAEDPGN